MENLESELQNEIDLMFDPYIDSLQLNIRSNRKIETLLYEKISFTIYHKIAKKLIKHLEKDSNNEKT